MREEFCNPVVKKKGGKEKSSRDSLHSLRRSPSFISPSFPLPIIRPSVTSSRSIPTLPPSLPHPSPIPRSKSILWLNRFNPTPPPPFSSLIRPGVFCSIYHLDETLPQFINTLLRARARLHTSLFAALPPLTCIQWSLANNYANANADVLSLINFFFPLSRRKREELPILFVSSLIITSCCCCCRRWCWILVHVSLHVLPKVACKCVMALPGRGLRTYVWRL